MNLNSTVLIFLLGNLSFNTSAMALDIRDSLQNGTTSKLLKNSKHESARWTGVGLLSTIDGTCSAALLDTRKGGAKATGPAYLITSGHCITKEIGTSTLNYKLDATVTFNYFNDTTKHHKTYKVHTANWTSMVGTDLAILEVEKTLDQLMQDGITPLRLAPLPPLGAHDVLNVGIPRTTPEQGLRVSACTQEISTTLSGVPPTFPGGLVNGCKNLAPGSSGSPMLDRRTNKITSIISENNYGFSPSFLSNCFRNGVFTNNTETCELQQVNVEVDFLSLFKTKVRPTWNSVGYEILPTWDYKFKIDTPYYRYKTVRDAMNCDNPDNYSGAINGSYGHITQSIGPEPRMHILCIIGVHSEKQKLTRTLLKNVFTHAVHLAEPAPKPTFNLLTNQRTSITWADSYPVFTSHFFYAGPADTTQCGDVEDKRYKKALSVEILPSYLPLKVCSYGQNETAFQPSAIRFDLIRAPLAP